MRHAITLGLVLMSSSLFTSGALSQTVETSTQQSRVTNQHKSCSMSFGPMSVTLVSGPTAPYSATEEHSSVQTLSDGTHITPKPVTVKIYRDSQGRRRREESLCRGRDDDDEGELVTILDPVAGFEYILDMQNHITHRITVEVTQRGTSRNSTNTKASPVPTASDHFTSSEANSPKVSEESESLGTQVMEGLTVEGTRTTTTIPVNAEHNDQPIMIVTETWFSRDLKTAILNKASDPRRGESTFRLTGVNLSEPDPALFQSPPDFKIVDDTEGGQFRIEFSR